MSKFKSFVLKFAKGAVFGGIGSVAAMLYQNHPTISSIPELVSFSKMLVAAAVSGAGLAIWKMIMWKD